MTVTTPLTGSSENASRQHALLAQGGSDLTVRTHLPESPAAPIANLVVIDARVDDLAMLVSGVVPGAEVVVLHPEEDGVAQLSALLAGRANLSALHLVSHGRPGSLLLGAGELDAAALRGLDWRGAFAADAEVLVYGCEAGAGVAGRELVAALHGVTGAAVAASSVPVGAAMRGGCGWVQ